LVPKFVWWALEAQADDHAALLRWTATTDVWSSPLARQAKLTENLVRRYALRGTHDDLLACAALFRQAPDRGSSDELLQGFAAAFVGRPIPPLPTELIDILARTEGRYALILRLRRGDPSALDEALKVVADPQAPPQDRRECIRAIGDVQADPARCVPALLKMLASEQDREMMVAELVALQRFDLPEVGLEIVDLLDRFPDTVRETAHSVLASRSAWALDLARAADTGKVAAETLTQDTVERLRLYADPELIRLVAEHFPVAKVAQEEYDRRIDLFAHIIRSGQGQPLVGQSLFFAKVGCGKCHRMFGAGGDVGPDLTPYNRGNLRHMLLSIVHPSAEIREGYENYTVATDDGQVLTGFKVEENGQILMIRGADGQDRMVPIDAIDSRAITGRSLMPDRLLDSLTDDELRDLFAFLSSTTPPK
jgi:putative heme-binding domain-containing protein